MYLGTWVLTINTILFVYCLNTYVFEYGPSTSILYTVFIQYSNTARYFCIRDFEYCNSNTLVFHKCEYQLMKTQFLGFSYIMLRYSESRNL